MLELLGGFEPPTCILTKDALYLLSYSSIYGDQEGARTLDLQRDRLAF